MNNRIWKYIFLYGAIWNVLGGIAILCLPDLLFVTAGLTPPDPPVYYYSWIALFMTFGVGYYMVFRDVRNNKNIAILGIIGKLAFATVFAVWMIRLPGQIPPLFAIPVAGDLIFVVLFWMSIIVYVRVQKHMPARRKRPVVENRPVVEKRPVAENRPVPLDSPFPLNHSTKGDGPVPLNSGIPEQSPVPLQNPIQAHGGAAEESIAPLNRGARGSGSVPASRGALGKSPMPLNRDAQGSGPVPPNRGAPAQRPVALHREAPGDGTHVKQRSPESWS